ncbi:MAG: hypothetical protein AB7E95_04720 [Kiritimatiellales bacterium]
MGSTDIYEVKENPWAERMKNPPSSPRRRRRSQGKSFEETVGEDRSQTHRRRSKNSGLRRFRHQMKKPAYSRKFWLTSTIVFVSVLLVLMVWDLFFRYPKQKPTAEPEVYRAVVE